MKKYLLFILSLVLLLSLFSFVGCNSGKDIHVHKFTTSVVDATCTAAGEKVYICDCGKTDVAEIPALGHSFKDGFCTRCGAVDLDNHEHIWTGPTCTEPQICELCSNTQGEPLGHAVVTDSRVDPTCTETGLTEGSHCSRCGETLVAQKVIGATGHTYEDSNECNVCGHIDTQYFTFTLLSDDTYEVKAKDVNNIPAHVVIPSEYDNRAVTEIGWGAFSGSDNLRSIVIPNSIRRISAVALAYCNGLTSVNIPDSVTLIDMNVFDRCYNLTSITVDENNAKYKDIEGNLYSKDGKTLIQYAIGKSETSFIILDNVTHIGRDALAFSINLTTIVLPDSVISIGDYAFHGCDNLASVVIGEGVANIGKAAFYYCERLTNIEVNENNKNYKDIDGNLYSKDGTVLIQYVMGNTAKSFTVPDSITTIGDYALAHNYRLESFVVGNNVISIGERALYNTCFSTIVIGGNVTFIGSDAFFACYYLTSVFYSGTVDGWKEVTIDVGNDYLLNATRYYYSEQHPTTEGNFWHYDENGEIAVWCYNPVIDSAVEPTCTETGLTEGSHCETCGDTLVAQEEIPALPHTYENSNQCSVCEYIDTQYFTFTLLENDTYEIVAKDVDNMPSRIAIPSGYSSKAVTAIGYNAFSMCYNLTSVQIPTSITSIGEYAFRCSGLTDVIFCNNSQLTSVDFGAFWSCESLSKIVIPDSVTTIGTYAFYGCSGLESITLPFIGASKHGTENTNFGYIFGIEDCYYQNALPNSLKTVTITGGTRIEDYAFYACRNLTEIKIPDNVTTFGSHAFYDCRSLTEIVIPDSVTSIGDHAFGECSSLTEIVIPDNVTSIGKSAFFGCVTLSKIYYNAIECEDFTADHIVFGRAGVNGSGIEVKIGANVKKIPAYLFFPTWDDHFMNNISSIEFEKNSECKSIGQGAFFLCSTLERVVMPDSVEIIGKKAFYDCSSLTEIVIPDNVISIEERAFAGCYSLTNIIFRENSQLISIGEFAFEHCINLTQIVVPNSVISIGTSAFHFCDNLKSITLPFVGETKDGIENTHIGFVFSGRNHIEQGRFMPASLKTVIITGGTSIGEYAFYDCAGLTEIILPDSVTIVGKYAFSGCDNLQFNIEGNLKYLGNNSNPYLYLFGSISTDITTVKINENCKIIGYDAFSGCGSLLTEIEIPNSVRSIGSKAFSSCSNLTEIEIPDSVMIIGERAFYYCGNLANVNFGENSQLTHIGDYAFYWCGSLTKIMIPDGVVSIGSAVFSECSSLYEIKVSENNANYKDINGNLYSKDGKTLIQYARGKQEDTFTVPDSVETIGDHAFYYCNIIKTVIFGKNSQLTCIEEGAFFECHTLREIIIPNSVILIGDYAFYNCNSLTELVIPDSVTSIGVGVFEECSSLSEIKVSENNANYKDIDGNLYSKDGKTLIQYAEGKQNTTFTIPDSVNTIGDRAFGSSWGIESIVIPNSVTRIEDRAFYFIKSLINVYYKGADVDWDQIVIAEYNNALTDATNYYYSEQEPAAEGNFWHYDENGDIAVWSAQG